MGGELKVVALGKRRHLKRHRSQAKTQETGEAIGGGGVRIDAKNPGTDAEART